MKKVLVLSLVLIILSTAGCGKKEGNNGKVKIKFWHSFVSSTIPALNELIAKFEKEFPNIDIEPQYVPSGDAHIQKLITSIQSKTAPDISWLHSDFMEDLVEADAVYKLEEFMKGENGISDEDFNDIYPSLRQYASWRGTLYSLPMEATNLALLYNKEMFRKAGLDPNHPPKTWDELYEFSKKLTFDKDGDGVFEQVGMSIPIFPAAGSRGSWMVWQWMPFLWQAGGDFIAKDQSQVLYNSPQGVDALNLWVKLFDELKLKTFTADFDVAFASKRLAMTMDGPWSLPRYKDLLKGLDWAFAPLPAGPAKQATIVGGEYLAIFKQTKHPKEAWQFLKWIVRSDVQAFWAMKSGYLPIRHGVKDVPEFKDYLDKNPNFRAFVDQMDVAQAQAQVDYGGLQITRHIAEAIEKATVGGQDAKKALDESAAKSNAILKEKSKKK